MTLRMLGMLAWVWAASAGAEPLGNLVVPELSLPGTDGATHALKEAGTLTVLTFFSADCPCMKAHDEVMKALAQKHAGKVRFFLVDSEAGASLEKDAAEARTRGYPMPILLDADGKLAKSLDARFATATVILDATGKVRYRGGIDSSKRDPGPGTKPYLKDALESLNAGKSPDPAEPKSLGCFLRQR